MDTVNFGPEYCKINTIWKRDENGKVIIGDWSRPESQFLADLPWLWTEKIDGTNIRLHQESAGVEVTVGGRTDNAQLPPKLVENMDNAGYLDISKWTKLSDKAGGAPITVYGEGYGAGIQKGGQYREDKDFIVFDVRVGKWWLQHENVCEVADTLGLSVVPYIGMFSPKVAWHRISTGDYSSAWPGAKLEGFVGKPLVDLMDRKGDRVIMKVKVKDWEDRKKVGFPDE